MITDAGHETSAICVALKFVRLYYKVMNSFPQFLHRFYMENSCLIHGGSPLIRGQAAIQEFITSMNLNDCRTKVIYIDAQYMWGNNIMVLVTGEVSNNGMEMRRFSQAFGLIENGYRSYYIRNDIFHYHDMESNHQYHEVNEYLDVSTQTNFNFVEPVMFPPQMLELNYPYHPYIQGHSQALPYNPTLYYPLPIAVPHNVSPTQYSSQQYEQTMPQACAGFASPMPEYGSPQLASSDCSSETQPILVEVHDENEQVENEDQQAYETTDTTDALSDQQAYGTTDTADALCDQPSPNQDDFVNTDEQSTPSRPCVEFIPKVLRPQLDMDFSSQNQDDFDNPGEQSTPSRPCVEFIPKVLRRQLDMDFSSQKGVTFVSEENLPKRNAPNVSGTKPRASQIPPTEPAVILPPCDEEYEDLGLTFLGPISSSGSWHEDDIDLSSMLERPSMGQNNLQSKKDVRTDEPMEFVDQSATIFSPAMMNASPREPFPQPFVEENQNQPLTRDWESQNSQNIATANIYPTSSQGTSRPHNVSPHFNHAKDLATYSKLELFIGNIPLNATEKELKNIFSRYGRVRHVKIIRKSNKQFTSVRYPLNYGFVLFDRPEDVQNCMNSVPIYYPDSSGTHRINVHLKKLPHQRFTPFWCRESAMNINKAPPPPSPPPPLGPNEPFHNNADMRQLDEGDNAMLP